MNWKCENMKIKTYCAKLTWTHPSMLTCYTLMWTCLCMCVCVRAGNYRAAAFWYIRYCKNTIFRILASTWYRSICSHWIPFHSIAMLLLLFYRTWSQKLNAVNQHMPVQPVSACKATKGLVIRLVELHHCLYASEPAISSLGTNTLLKAHWSESFLLPLPICLLSFSAHQRRRHGARVMKGPAFLLWAWENVEKQISCVALSLRMIKNKVNPVAA